MIVSAFWILLVLAAVIFPAEMPLLLGIGTALSCAAYLFYVYIPLFFSKYSMWIGAGLLLLPVPIGIAAAVLNAAILARQRGDRKLDSAISSACLDEVARLERHLNILGTIGYIAPLLGLLGTVLGLMEAFQAVHATASVYLSVTELASAVNQALITTASGLAVAIFCYAAYNYLHARLDAMTLDIEKAASEISAFFERHEQQ